jgi:hypothetical protein
MKIDVDVIGIANLKVSLPFDEFRQQVELYSRQSTESGDTRATASDTKYAAGERGVHPAEYRFAPVFDDPACQKPYRIEARKVQFAN